MKHLPFHLRCGLVILAVAIATALRFALHGLFGQTVAFITFYPAVALVAMFLGAGAGVAATVLSAVAADYFAMPPLYALGPSHPAQAVALGLFAASGLLISLMARQIGLARRREAEAAERERVREELIRAVAETERQRQLLAVTLASIGDGVIVTDVQGRVTFLNGEAERLTGWKNNDTAGQPLSTVFRIINERTRQPVESPVEQVLRLGKVVGLANHTILIARDGREIPIDDSGAPIRHADGTVQGVVLVFRDFTERKAAEEALRQAKATLEQKVAERTAELLNANRRLTEENQERIRTEQSLRREEARLDALLHLSQMGEAPLNEVASFTLERAIALTDSRIGFVGFLNEDESVYTLHAVSRDVVKECSVAGDPVQWHVVDAGIWADAIREHKTLFVNDYSKPHPRKKGLPSGHPYVPRFMVVPILDGRRIVAIAGVGNKASDYDKADERQIVLLLSGMWACTQKNRAREQLQKAYNELETKVQERTAELAASAAALRQSQQDLTRAQTVGQIGSWRLDLRRNVLTWSEETHRIFGVPPGTPMTYEAFLTLVHPEDRQYVDAQWKAGLRGEPYDVEHRIVADGHVKWVREKAYLEFDETETLLGGFGITQDITERKQAQRQLEELNQTLERRVAERTAEAKRRAEQLQALAARLTQAEQNERQRLATILHDHLQQLLVGAKFHLGVLRGRRQEPDVREPLDQIDALLDQSLETSRNLTVDLSPPILMHGNMTQVLRWLADWMRSKHGLEVKLHADEQADPQAHEVRVLLYQATRELLFNVVKHAQVDQATVELCRPDDRYIQVTVRDKGVGFAPSEAGDGNKGSGFGLLAIRERLEWLNGSLDVDSRLGEGTVATLTVPVVLPNIARLSAAQTAAAIHEARDAVGVDTHANGKLGGRIRVLLVDDHVVMRDGLAGSLEKLPDMQVVGKAADGQEAVDLAAQVRPDVVIMDVSMPGMDGVEATRQIMARQPGAKVIGLCMFHEKGMLENMKAAGAACYLAKTSGLDALIAAVRECAAGRSG
jgi:PAS domain S-box-containing protein